MKNPLERLLKLAPGETVGIKVATQVRHRRIGPGLDVALCGARGLFMYALTQKHVTCDACKAKHASLRGTNRMAVQMAAKRAKARAGWSRSLGARF